MEMRFSILDPVFFTTEITENTEKGKRERRLLEMWWISPENNNYLKDA